MPLRRKVLKPLSPSPLLRLPRELRNEIYAYLIYEHQSPPPNPSFAQEPIWADDIAYPKRYRSWRYSNLMWTNRQLRDEYIDLVDELTKGRRVKAELDIMSKGYCFWTTWLFLPPELLENGPIDLFVHLRIFSTEAYRSNDGWPRQPGAGFRCLLKLLHQFIHGGPSFGKHKELLRGMRLFAINNLSITISFHDDYTPDTWPETAHNIFKMLKALALDGPAKNVVKRIHVGTEYDQYGAQKRFNGEWEVSNAFDPGKATQWRSMGFLHQSQKGLSDDDHADLDDDFV